VLLKTMKSFVVKIAKEEFGHFVLLAAFDVVDDTKFVQKVILDVRLTKHFFIVVVKNHTVIGLGCASLLGFWFIRLLASLYCRAPGLIYGIFTFHHKNGDLVDL